MKSSSTLLLGDSRWDAEMFDLIKTVDNAGQMVYKWLRNGVSLEGHLGFSDIHQAAEWFQHNHALTYFGPERRLGADRRSGYERRNRVSGFERRQRPQGRRWVDELDRFQ